MVKGFKLSVKQTGLDKAIRHMTALENNFGGVIEDLTKEGEAEAVWQLNAFGAVYTHDLASSITSHADKYSGYITTGDNDHAHFVEFGTGIIGANSSHPEAGKHGWVYDKNAHGQDGWLYFNENDGKMHRTSGYISRPFMYNTRKYLERIMPNIIRARLRKKK